MKEAATKIGLNINTNKTKALSLAFQNIEDVDEIVDGCTELDIVRRLNSTQFFFAIKVLK